MFVYVICMLITSKDDVEVVPRVLGHPTPLLSLYISSVYTRYVTSGNLLYASIIHSLQRDSLTSLQIPTPHHIQILFTQKCSPPDKLTSTHK